jgi:hypothetical protein
MSQGIHHLVEAFESLTMAELRIYGGETDYASYSDRGQFFAQLHRSPHIRVWDATSIMRLGAFSERSMSW